MNDDELKRLQEENSFLKKEVDELKQLNADLMTSDDEDSRILKTYKAKNFQLERQVQVLTKCNLLRSEMMSEIENFVLELNEEVQIPSIDSAYLKKWAKGMSEKIRNYNILTKQAENQKYYMNSKYCSDKIEDSIQNVCNYSCNDDIPYLEVMNVLELEKDLNHAYRNLHRLKLKLEENLPTNEDPNLNMLVNITIGNITKVLNEMVELSLILPKKEKGNHFNNPSYDQFYNPMSLNTNELMSLLPKVGNSKVSKELEVSIKSLVKAFHAQKNLFEIDLQMKHEDMMIFYKTCEFYKKYFSEMLKEIEANHKQYLNLINASLMNGSSEAIETLFSTLDTIVKSFRRFDKESNEINLRNFILSFKDNIHVIDEMKQPALKKTKSYEIQLQKYYDQFLKEIAEIEAVYEIKKKEFVGEMYKLDEELAIYQNMEPIISFSPYDNSSTIALKKVQKKKTPKNPKLQSSRIDAKRNDDSFYVSKKEEITKPQKKSSTEKVSPSYQSLVDEYELKNLKLEELRESLTSSSLTDMKKYALKKQIVST
ncbi:hypothetical protein ABK040_015127 [Willaertia magna]